MFRLVILCWNVWSYTLVTCKPPDDLFKTYLKSRNLESMYNIFASTTLAPPSSYAIVNSASAETAAAPVNDTALKDDSNTESPLQAVFNELAAENYPRMLNDMGQLNEDEIKEHPVYKAFYYTATKAGQDWRSFYESLKNLSPTQVRDALKLVNTFNKMAKKGGVNEADKQFLKGYQQDLFADFQKLNDIKLSDKDKEEIAQQYKKKEPHFLKENDNLQRRLEAVMKKFSSDEIRNDPGLLNMRHVGIDPEQFVTLKRMVEDKMREERQWNQTLAEMVRNNMGPEPVTHPSETLRK